MIFRAISKFAVVEYEVLCDRSIEGVVHFKNLDGVSAIHIQSAARKNPILVWLATSEEWDHGIAQRTPGSNGPCCYKENGQCDLVAPCGTPNTKSASFKKMKFRMEPPRMCKDGCCPWVSKGTVLKIHGYCFQKLEKGCPTRGRPGRDVLESVCFEKLEACEESWYPSPKHQHPHPHLPKFPNTSRLSIIDYSHNIPHYPARPHLLPKPYHPLPLPFYGEEEEEEYYTPLYPLQEIKWSILG